MPANSSKSKDNRNDDLKEAQPALDAAAHLPEPHRAGKTAKKILGLINGASHSDAFGMLLDGVYSLAESLPPLSARLMQSRRYTHFYPVIVELEIKRHDNDKKVNLLFLEMRNMMASLLQLQNVRENHAGRDGITISKRLGSNDRKAEFSSIHTGLGVDDANDKLDVVMTQMDVILEFFEKTAPREQRILADMIRKEGGTETVLAKTEVLQQLLLKRAATVSRFAAFSSERQNRGWDYYDVLAGIESSPLCNSLLLARCGESALSKAAINRDAGLGTTTLQSHMERPIFSQQPPHIPGISWQTPHDGTWTRQQEDQEFAENAVIGRLMQDLADEPAVAICKNLVWFERRVISSVLAGPHEGILDRDLSSIFKDMRWRGIVKARYLVLAIHDYYAQKLDHQQHTIARSVTPQRLVDADDVAGAQDYLTDVKQLVQDFTGFFREDSEHLPLLSRFQDYVNQQEANIRERLETANYDLDMLDTLALVNGPLGLERNVFVILYLLLRRHLDIMRLAQKVLIHPDELVDAAAAIVLLWSAYGAVNSAPLQLNLSVNNAYDTDYGLAGDQLSVTILKYPPFREDLYPESDDCIEDEGSEVADVLKPLLGHWAGIRRRESHWTVYRRILPVQRGSYEIEKQVQTMMAFAYDFHISPTDPNIVVAAPATNIMEFRHTRLLVTGEYAGTEDDGRARFLMTEAFNSSNIPDLRIELVLSEDGMTLSSGQDGTFSVDSGQVVMKKGSSPEVMMFYPPDFPSLRESKPEALWRFAREAVLYDVRRRRFSWCFIKERRDRKRTLTSLLHAQAVNGALYVEELAELNRLLSMTLPADAHFFARACLEPAMFPWLLPWCQKCRRVLMTVDPCIRCALCGPATPTAGTAVFDCLACVEDHLEYSTHRILNTRVAGSTMDKLLEESGIDLAKLDELFESGMRAISNRLEGTDHFNDGFASYGLHSPSIARSRP
ncbi:hypothetical protein BD414DRAFT_534077 [Trametes punicea]|nr:hypothetical protein BD414DRAFT_534077 [Trametes punicea]